jgi:CheY-like chemotaxis protein
MDAIVAEPRPAAVTEPRPKLGLRAMVIEDDPDLAEVIADYLQRSGCDGEISGEWNAATKRAMAQFISRLNAALPSEEPDHILRAMVQGYPGNACGRTAPSAIVAQSAATKAAQKAADHQVRDVATARPTVPRCFRCARGPFATSCSSRST